MWHLRIYTESFLIIIVEFSSISKESLTICLKFTNQTNSQTRFFPQIITCLLKTKIVQDFLKKLLLPSQLFYYINISKKSEQDLIKTIQLILSIRTTMLIAKNS